MVFLEHWLPQLLALAGMILLLQLAVTALALASAALLVLLATNNKKVTLLREPLLPCDIALVVRHPHTWELMSRYAERAWLVAAGIAGGAAAIVATAACEPWLFGHYRFGLAIFAPLPPMAIMARWRGELLWIRCLKALGLPFCDWDILTDMAAGGFFSTFICGLDTVPRPAIATMTSAEARRVLNRSLNRSSGGNDGRLAPAARKPNIIMVLAEAFFDPRAAGLSVEPNPLVNYEAAVGRSAYHGLCQVPVFGGWSVRSEYSLLTGISILSFANSIGNPNSTLVRGAAHALPKYLKTQGYRTMLVHPFQRQYYRRDKASVSLGFDTFLDEQCFGDAPRDGVFISDLAVSARIGQEIGGATEPTFLFCATMENHGPYQPGIVPGMAPFSTQPPLGPKAFAEFAPYLHHLRNADAMIGQLMKLVSAAKKPTLLLVVGDHRPALPEVFAEVGCVCKEDEHGWRPTATDRSWYQTPYFLLTNWSGKQAAMDCDISFLPGLVLDCVGLNGDRFFRENSAMRRLSNGKLYDDTLNPPVRAAYLRHTFDMAVFPERYVSTRQRAA